MFINLRRFIGRDFFVSQSHVAFVCPSMSKNESGEDIYEVSFALDVVAQVANGSTTAMTFNFKTKIEQAAKDLISDLGVLETIFFEIPTVDEKLAGIGPAKSPIIKV